MPHIDPLVAEVQLQTGTLKSQFNAVADQIKQFKSQIDSIFNSIGGGSSGGGAAAIQNIGTAAEGSAKGIDKLIAQLQLVDALTRAGISGNKSYAETLDTVKVGLAGLKAGDAKATVEAFTRSIQENKQALKDRDADVKSSAKAQEETLTQSFKRQAVELKAFNDLQEKEEREHQATMRKLLDVSNDPQQQQRTFSDDFSQQRKQQAAIDKELRREAAVDRAQEAQEQKRFIERENIIFQEEKKRLDLIEKQQAAETKLLERLEAERASLEQSVQLQRTLAQATGDVKTAKGGLGVSDQNKQAIQDNLRGIAQAKQELREINATSNGFFEQIRKNLGRIATFTLGASILVRGFFALQNALVGIVKSGVEFNSTLEQAKFGIAALLTNSRELASASGEIASQAASYPIFLEKAKRFQKEIQILDAQTLGTGQELQSVFERVLAFSQNQVATDKERLQLAANILNASKLLGLEGEQVATETRQILTLERDQGQQILQTLGLRAKELRAYQEQGTLVQKLNDLLKVYSIIASDVGLSFEGLVTTATTFFDILKGQSFEGTFGGLKEILKGVGEELKAIGEGGSAQSGLNASSQQLRELGKNLADIAASVTKFLADGINGIIAFAAKAQNGLNLLKQPIVGFVNTLGGALEMFGLILTAIDKIIDRLPHIQLPEGLTKFLPGGNTGRIVGAGAQGASAGLILGAAAAPLTGGASLVALPSLFAGLASLKAALNIQDEQAALNKFATEAPQKIKDIKETIDSLTRDVNTQPQLFQTYLKAIPLVRKGVEEFKNEILSLPEGPVKEEGIQLVKRFEDGIDGVTASLERMKGGIKTVFSTETIKVFDDIAKSLKDAQDELNLQLARQEVIDRVKGSGGTKEQLDIELERVEATRKILNNAEEYNKAIREAQTNQNIRPITTGEAGTTAFEQNLEAFKLGKVEFKQIFNSLNEVAAAEGNLAAGSAAIRQSNEEKSNSFGEQEKAVEKLKEALVSLKAETESANASFAKTISAFGQNEEAVAQARIQTINTQFDKTKGELAKKFGDADKIPAEAIAQLNERSLAQTRAALAEEIKEIETFSNKRIAIIEQASKRELDIRNAEIATRKILNQTELDNLTFQQKQADENAGISGRVNNGLQDRVRLIGEVAQAEQLLITAEIAKERAGIDVARAENDKLAGEIIELKRKREVLLSNLKNIDTTGTPEEQQQRFADTTKEVDRDIGLVQSRITKNNAQTKEAEANLISYGQKATRVAQQAADDINKVTTTVVHLNDPFANFLTNILDGFQKGSLKFKDIFKTLQSDITSAFSNAFRESIKKKLQFDFDVKDNIGGLGGFIKDTFSGAFDFVGNLFKNFGINLGTGSGGGGFLSSIFGGGSTGGGSTGGGSSGGFLSNLFGGGSGGSVLGASGGSAPLVGTNFLSSIFGGDQANPTTAFAPGSPLSAIFGNAPATGPGGSFAGTNVFGGTGPVSTFAPGSPLSGLFGGGSTAGGTSAIGGSFLPSGGGGIGQGVGLGLLGNSGAELTKSLFGFGGSKQAQLGGNIGGLVGGIAGFALTSILGPLGPLIGSFVGNMLGSLIGGLFAPGRIATEKTDIQKSIGQVLPGIPTKVVKEPVAAAGLANLKEDNPALIALGAQFASTDPKATPGTIKRYAAQLAADLTAAGKSSKSAQADIEKLAQSLKLDLASGIDSINGLVGKNILSLSAFQKGFADSQKNLKQYGDTANLTVKELNDLAIANGNTGSRITTVGEALAGVIDISTGFDQFISGTTIANNYLADSFDKVAKEGNVFNDQLKDVEAQIRSGKLSLEEGILALNKFRKEAGLAAVDLSKFSIDATVIQKQVDVIKTAVDTIRTAFKTAIASGISGANPLDIEKAFRTTVEQALVDAVVNGMVDGFIKAAQAAGPISEALSKISDLVTKFVGGDLTQEDFFTKVRKELEASGPAIEKLAKAAGYTAEQFRQMLKDIPGFNDLLGGSLASQNAFTQGLQSAGKTALEEGIAQGLSSPDVATAFKGHFYTSFVSTIEDAMVAGIVNASLASGPLKDALASIGKQITDFGTGKIGIDEFLKGVKDTLDVIKPVVEAIATATGLSVAAIRDILKEKNIKIDVSVSTTGLATSLTQAGKTALSSGITSGLSSSQVATAFKGNFYTAFADTVEQAMVDGIVNAALAAGPLKAALDSIGSQIADVASGKVGIEQFTTSVGQTLDKIKPVIDAIAEAVGITSAKLKGLLEAKGITLDLKTSGFNFTDSLRDATASAIIEGIVQGSSSAEVATSIRRGLYKTILDAVVQAFIQGLVNASLSAGPLKAATEGFSKAFADFTSNKTDESQFAADLRKTFAGAIPFVKRFSDSLGVSSGIISDFFKELGILPDVLGDTAKAAADLAHSLRKAAQDLLLDNALSPLKPKERVSQAEVTFEKLRADALAGNKEAAAKLPEAGQKFLEEARKVFASSTPYEKIFDFVRTTLLDVADKIDPVVASGDEQLRTLKDIRQELADFGDRLFQNLTTQERFNGILLGLVGNPGSSGATPTPTGTSTSPGTDATTPTTPSGAASGGPNPFGANGTVPGYESAYYAPQWDQPLPTSQAPNPYGGSSQNTTAYVAQTQGTGTKSGGPNPFGATGVVPGYEAARYTSQNDVFLAPVSNPYGGQSINTTGQSYGKDVLTPPAGKGQPYGRDVLTVTDSGATRELRASSSDLHDIKTSNQAIAKNTSQTAANTGTSTGIDTGPSPFTTPDPNPSPPGTTKTSLVQPTGPFYTSQGNLINPDGSVVITNWGKGDNASLHPSLGNGTYGPHPMPGGGSRDLVPIGTQTPGAWGTSTYLGADNPTRWSAWSDIPPWVQALGGGQILPNGQVGPKSTTGMSWDDMNPVSLASGGIVTGKEVPALLHGPEAVIPLGTSGKFSVTSPSLEKQLMTSGGDLKDIKTATKAIAANTDPKNPAFTSAPTVQNRPSPYPEDPAKLAFAMADPAHRLVGGSVASYGRAKAIRDAAWKAAGYGPDGPPRGKQYAQGSVPIGTQTQGAWGVSTYLGPDKGWSAWSNPPGDTGTSAGSAGSATSSTGQSSGVSSGTNASGYESGGYVPGSQQYTSQGNLILPDGSVVIKNWGKGDAANLHPSLGNGRFGPHAMPTGGDRNPVPVGTMIPSAWGPNVYLGNGKWKFATAPDSVVEAVLAARKANNVSLAEGGIVRSREVSATLHGPEAIIPLPTSSGRVEVSVPDLLGEIRMLREEMRNRGEEKGGDTHVHLEGSYNIGSEKMGEFVVNKVQTSLRKGQMQVPKNAVKG